MPGISATTRATKTCISDKEPIIALTPDFKQCLPIQLCPITATILNILLQKLELREKRSKKKLLVKWTRMI